MDETNTLKKGQWFSLQLQLKFSDLVVWRLHWIQRIFGNDTHTLKFWTFFQIEAKTERLINWKSSMTLSPRASYILKNGPGKTAIDIHNKVFDYQSKEFI